MADTGLMEKQSLNDKVLIEELLREHEDDPELRVTSLESSPACAVGDNFMSSVTRLVVNIERKQKHLSKKSFFLKRQLESQERREALKGDPAFQNEIAAYQTVLPAMEKFLGGSLPFPRCLHASLEYIVFSDLDETGFKMADRKNGLNLQEALLTMKELGKFHGISLAMKQKEPKLFNTMRYSVQEFLYVASAALGYGEMLENALNVAISSLKTLSKKDKQEINPIIEKMEKLRGTVFFKLFEIVCPREPLAVICHGDFYVNNLLFKCNENGTPEEVAIVDFQVCKYTSLATDVLYFFGSSLQRGLLLSAHDELLEIYYSSLKNVMLQCGCNSENITLDLIKEEIKNCSLYGLIKGALLLQVVTAKPGAIDNEKEPDAPTIENTLKFLGPDYFSRMEDLVLTFNKLGYL